MRLFLLRIACFVGILPLKLFGQSYQLATNFYGVSSYIQGAYNGAGLSVADFDRDGWDDITFCSRNSPIRFYHNTQGAFELVDLGITTTGEVKSAIWCDYDNDQDSDLLLTLYQGKVALWLNDGAMIFTDISAASGIPQTVDAMTFGASFGDYDRDGNLDLYICNYNWPDGSTNWLLHNNGDGTFENVSETSVSNDGNRRSFQSVFMDYDGDLWPDLYVINDKFTRNSMYHNMGNGVFEDVSEVSATDLYMESMSNSVCDFDRDGDLDIYVSNSTLGNELLVNHNGYFTHEGADAGVSFNSLCWGALWIDGNNDSWSELYVQDIFNLNNDQNRYYQYNLDTTFSQIIPGGMSTDFYPGYSLAKGDFDNNGYPDIVVVNMYPSNACIWKNGGGANHFIKVNLQGVVSNTDGIGSWVEAFCNQDSIAQYTRSSDSYLSQDSQTIIFGLGEADHVDSLIVTWPSGLVDVLTNINADQVVQVVEGSTLTIAVNAAQNVYICPGDSLLLTAEADLPIIWSNGAEGSSLWIDEAGEYQAFGIFNGDTLTASPMTTAFNVQDIIVNTTTTNESCAGAEDGAIEVEQISGPEISSILWSTGVYGFSADNLVPGNYIGFVQDIYNCSHQIEASVMAATPIEASVTVGDVQCNGDQNGVAIVEKSGGYGILSIDWQGADPSYLGAGNYSITISDAMNCSEELFFVIEEPSPLSMQIEEVDFIADVFEANATVFGGTLPYSFEWSNGILSNEMSTSIAGVYICTATDAHGCEQIGEITFTATYLQNQSFAHLLCFPQPTSGELHIVGGYGLCTLRLFDASGRLVHTQNQLSLAQSSIDISHLSNGIYQLQLSGESEYHSTVLIQH